MSRRPARRARRDIRASVLLLAVVLVSPTRAATLEDENAEPEKKVLEKDPELGSDRAWRRVRAARRLAAKKDEGAIAQLLEAVKEEKDPIVREEIVLALGGLEDERIHETLLRIALDAKAIRELRLAAARSLARSSRDRARAALLEAVKDSRGPSRLPAAEAMRFFADDEILAELLLVYRERGPSDEIRMALVQAFEAARDSPELATLLIAALRSWNDTSKSRVAFAMGRLRLAAAVDALLEFVGDPQAEVRRACLLALVRCARPEDDEKLRTALTRARPEDLDFALSLYALGGARSDSRASLRLWQKGLSDDDYLTASVSAWALSRQKTPESQRALASRAGSGKEQQREVSALGLGWQGDEKSLRTLLGLHRHSKPRVRYAAIEATGAIFSDRAASGLERALRSKNPELQARAAQSLRRVGVPVDLELCKRALRGDDLDLFLDVVYMIGGSGKEEHLELLLEGAKTWKEPRGRALAVQGILEIAGRTGALQFNAQQTLKMVEGFVEDPSPLVRAAAYHALQEAKHRDAIPVLVQAMKDETELAAEMMLEQALRTLSGEDFGDDRDGWLSWLRDRFEAAGKEAKADDGVTVSPSQRDAIFLQSLRLEGLDLAFVFDVTSSMGESLRVAQSRMVELASAMGELVPSFRLGFVAYRDEVAEIAPLSHDAEAVQSGLTKLHALGGGDIPEGVSIALETAIRDLGWRPRARKVIVVIGDAPPHDADRAAALAHLARETRGVIVNTLNVRPDNTSLLEFESIARQGGGSALRLREPAELISEVLVLALGEDQRRLVRDFMAARTEPDR